MDKTISDISEKYAKWEGCGCHSNADFLQAGNDITELLAKIDAKDTIISEGREIVKMLKGALTPGSIIDYEDVLKVDAWLEGGTE